eukprot:scaffold23489_cov31-Tisochrysis_lutea.AAC.1
MFLGGRGVKPKINCPLLSRAAAAAGAGGGHVGGGGSYSPPVIICVFVLLSLSLWHVSLPLALSLAREILPEDSHVVHFPLAPRTPPPLPLFCCWRLTRLSSSPTPHPDQPAAATAARTAP